MPNSPAAAVGLERQARAGVITPVSACASGSEGIAHAWRNIVLGEADVAICGGVETRIEAVPIAGFAQMRIVLSTTNDDPAGACRPFDKDRNGFVFGEGGALMVIETEEHAKARGANILARLMGASITSDGYHIVAPDPNGEQAGYAMTRAIQLAGLTPNDIDHVNAHATGTTVGDVAEGKAINALGSHRPAVYAPKAALGHSVGAVGAVESILTVLALRDGVIPPTNLRNLDPEIDLDVVAGSHDGATSMYDQQFVRIRWAQRRARLRQVLTTHGTRFHDRDYYQGRMTIMAPKASAIARPATRCCA